MLGSIVKVLLLMLCVAWRSAGGFHGTFNFVEEEIIEVEEGQVADVEGLAIDDLDEVDEHGKTPLMYAAIHAHWQAVKNLCTAGADSSLALADGTAALTMAAERGFSLTVKAMVDKCVKLDTNQMNKKGKSALSAAVVGGFAPVVEHLLDGGADANVQLRDDKSLLMVAAEPAIVALLIKHGANPNHADTSGNTPLMFASTLNETESVRALLEANADPNAQNRAGGTALMYAASRALGDVVRVLVEHGASVDVKDRFGSTALQTAVEKEAGQACLDALMEVGADFRGTGVFPSKEVLAKRALFIQTKKGREVEAVLNMAKAGNRVL